MALSTNDTLSFSVERLEERQMLSTVTIYAAGEVGDEQMQLIGFDDTGEIVLQSWDNVGGDANNGVFNTFTYSDGIDGHSLDVVDFGIRFANDLYSPEEGIDRNLRIDRIELDGVTLQTEGYDVFSTGTWKPEDGVQEGYRRSEYLHANGDIYFESFESNAVFFASEFWRSSDGSNFRSDEVFEDPDTGVLQISGARGEISLYREFEFESGTHSRLTVSAKRILESGRFDDRGMPWVTAGIDFYDDAGNKIDQQTIELNIPFENDDFETKSINFDAPANATNAYGWIWHQGTTDGRIISLAVEEFSFESGLANPDDTTPPTIELQPFTFTETLETTINFGVEINDDNQLPNSPLSSTGILVTGPNGFSEITPIATGIDTGSPNSQLLIMTLAKPDGSRWSSSDNGTYTVSLLDDSLVDRSGNTAPAQTVGTFEVNITDLPTDTEPPTIALNPVPVVTSPTPIVQFSVQMTDNQDPFATTNGLRVIRPDGTNEIVTAIAGGAGGEPNSVFEIFEFDSNFVKPSFGTTNTPWGPEHNGIYTIVLDDGQLVDESGNATPSRVLGTFEIAIEEVLAT
jgi:hypothetical protein